MWSHLTLFLRRHFSGAFLIFYSFVSWIGIHRLPFGLQYMVPGLDIDFFFLSYFSSLFPGWESFWLPFGIQVTVPGLEINSLRSLVLYFLLSRLFLISNYQSIESLGDHKFGLQSVLEYSSDHLYDFVLSNKQVKLPLFDHFI